MNVAIRTLLLLPLLWLAGCTSSSAPKPAHSGETISEARKETAAGKNAELGVNYLRQRNYKRALNRLHKALELDPELPAAYLYLGQLYSELDEFDDAEANFRKAIELDPGDSSAHNNFGVFLCERRRYAESEAEFQRVVSDPFYEKKAATYENMALCALGAGQQEKAEGYFKEALKQTPFMPRSLFNMAQISYDRGDARAAKLYLQRYDDVASPTPEVLWLGINVERTLGNRDAQASLTLLLEGRFPNSPEARRLKASRQAHSAGAR